MRRRSERGNIFFTLFGAVAVVGVLGAGIMATMRGPLSTMVEVNRRTQADAEMTIAGRLALLEAVQDSFDGDCDVDNFIEPLEHDGTVVAGLTGGGNLPAQIGSNKVDPWGIKYGYCVWDAGAMSVSDDVSDCGGNTADRLEGTGDNDNTYSVVALISAGPDRQFQTTCAGGAAPSVTKANGSDDIIKSYTYAEADSATGGLWSLKGGEPGTAEIDKNLEIKGQAKFQDGIDLSDAAFGASAQLKLGAASMLLPTQATLSTCDAANRDLLRINTGEIPHTVEICDDLNGGWVSSTAGSSLWKNDGAGGPTEIYYSADNVGIGTNNPATTLDITGTFNATSSATLGDTLNVTGATTVSSLNATGIVDFDTTLNVDGNTTLLGTLDVTNATTLLSTLRIDGDISDSNSAVTIADDMSITGDINMSTDTKKISWGAGTVNITGSTAANTLDVTASDIGLIGDTTVTGSAAAGTGDSLIVKDSLSANLFVVQHDGNVGIGVDDPNDALDVSGDIDATGGINATTTLDAGTDITAGGNITGTDILATSEFYVGGATIGTADKLGPVAACDTATEKLEWNDGSGWSCETDHGSGGGTGGSQNLTNILDEGNDANARDAFDFNQMGAVEFCNADLSKCFDPETVADNDGGIFERNLTVVRAKSPVIYSTDDFVFGSPQLDDDGDANNDTRLFFDKSQAAFRAGSVTGTQWDEAQIGWGSIGMGYNAGAEGASSIALGRETRATGDYSLALGLGNPAAVHPIVSGQNALGIFMGDHSGINLVTANQMSLMGGKLMIDPNVSATELTTSASLTVDVEGDIGAINYCDEDGSDCFSASDFHATDIWHKDGTNNYIEYDDSLGGVRIGKVTGEPAPAIDWNINTGTSTIYTSTNTVAIGSSSTSGTLTVDIE
ncbi:MAG: hypothetical protein KAJ86_02035, partial [Alphaproteobacteria bacterium]|nr:hypothetical protein [Alphaproteobacteria bacterium]